MRGALDGVAEIEIFNIKDKFYSRGEEIVDLINNNTNCKATMNDLADKDLLKEKMHAADLFCDAGGVECIHSKTFPTLLILPSLKKISS